jgi:hypothetical protein
VEGAGVYTIFTGLNVPAGVAYKNDVLYIAQSNKITAYDWDSKIQPVWNAHLPSMHMPTIPLTYFGVLIE